MSPTPNSNVHAASPLGRRGLPSAAQLKCSLDELVVGRDPAVGGEDHELEAHCGHLAIGGNHLPAELDDVIKACCVRASPE